jgi:hypothetical protein
MSCENFSHNLFSYHIDCTHVQCLPDICWKGNRVNAHKNASEVHPLAENHVSPYALRRQKKKRDVQPVQRIEITHRVEKLDSDQSNNRIPIIVALIGAGALIIAAIIAALADQPIICVQCYGPPSSVVTATTPAPTIMPTGTPSTPITPSPTVFLTVNPCIIKPNTKINIRPQPGTKYPAEGTVKVGTQLTPIGQSLDGNQGKWWQISNGWIADRVVTVFGDCNDVLVNPIMPIEASSTPFPTATPSVQPTSANNSVHPPIVPTITPPPPVVPTDTPPPSAVPTDAPPPSAVPTDTDCEDIGNCDED